MSASVAKRYDQAGVCKSGSDSGGERSKRMRPRLILASASPRRRHLLLDAGYDFEIDPSRFDEPSHEGTLPPFAYCANLAFHKALEVAERRRSGLILAADTIGVVDREVLNKPAGRDDAERMIRIQEGRDSEVLTAICLFQAATREWVGTVETTVIHFRNLTDPERTEFLDSNRWMGKAGAYGLQDGDPFLSIVSGTFSNVVGLPMERLARLLRDHPSLVIGESR